MNMKLNPKFWDCECEHQYIHSTKFKQCPRCGAREEDQPESREDEILEGEEISWGDIL